MNKQIFNLAIPNIISNITIPLLGMVDLAIMGHLDSEKYLGAISLGGMIFSFIYMSFNFLRMGTSGLTAQAFGRNDSNEIIYLLIRSILIAIICGMLLIILQVPIEGLGFYLIKGSEEVEDLAAQYFYIRIYAAPATIGLFAITGWFIGLQDAKTPMFIAILINVLNLLLNLLFVFKLNMKSDGVALGTLISQYAGFFAASYIILKKHGCLFKKISAKMVFYRSELKRFLKVNRDIFIRTVVLISVFSFFTAESAKISDKVLAINSLLLQFTVMFSFVMDGFAYAAEALSGKYLGMKNKVMLKKSVKYLFLWGIIFSLFFSLTYFTFGEDLIGLFTDNLIITNGAKPFLVWIAISPLISFASYLWDGIYIGVTASKAMRDTMLISSLVIFFPIYFLIKPYLNNHALWVALLIFLLARGVFQTFFAKKAVFSLANNLS